MGNRLWGHEFYITDRTKRTQLRFFDYIKYFLYLSVIITIIFQQEVKGF